MGPSSPLTGSDTAGLRNLMRPRVMEEGEAGGDPGTVRKARPRSLGHQVPTPPLLGRVQLPHVSCLRLLAPTGPRRLRNLHGPNCP